MTATLLALILACNPHLPAGEMEQHNRGILNDD